MSNIITLALEGEAVRLASMKIVASMQYKEQDQSGQSSSTARAEQGIKAKELRISGLIPFSEPQRLARLFELGSATDKSGKLHVYRVASLTAQAINFRQATFTGSIDTPQQDGQMAWLVTFTLREHSSVPEQKQARVEKKVKTKTQKQSAAGPSASQGDDKEKLTWFESRVLKPWEN